MTYLWSIGTSVPCDIPHNLGEVLCIFNDINMAQHLQIGELGCYRGYLGGIRSDEPVCVLIKKSLTFSEVMNA